MIASARGDIDHEAGHGTGSAATDTGNAHGHATDVERTTEATGAGIGRGVASIDDEMIVQSGGESEAQATSDHDHVRGTVDHDGEAGRRMSPLRQGGTEHGVCFHHERLLIIRTGLGHYTAAANTTSGQSQHLRLRRYSSVLTPVTIVLLQHIVALHCIGRYTFWPFVGLRATSLSDWVNSLIPKRTPERDRLPSSPTYTSNVQ